MQKTYSRNNEWHIEIVMNGQSAVLIPKVSEKTDLSKIVQLNQTGTHIWQTLESPKTIDQLAESFQNEFQNFSGNTSEIETFLKSAVELGAITN